MTAGPFHACRALAFLCGAMLLPTALWAKDADPNLLQREESAPINPLRALPDELRLAVLLPATLAFGSQPKLVFEIEVPGKPIDATPIPLIAAPDEPANGLPPAKDLVRHILRLEPKQAQGLLGFQQRIAALKSAGIHGSMNMRLDGRFCTSRPGATQSPIELYLRPTKADTFQPLLTGGDATTFTDQLLKDGPPESCSP